MTPANPTIAAGLTQQFTATGTYSDATTANLTGSVTWASSNTAAATINSSGLATGVAAGTSTISATLGAVSGSTTLTVTAPPTSFTLSGTVSTSGGPLAGAEIFVFNAGNGAYVKSGLSVAGGGYSFDLAAGGSYKLFIQPHETGFPDQWHGGADFAGATTILLDTDKTVDLSLAP